MKLSIAGSAHDRYSDALLRALAIETVREHQMKLRMVRLHAYGPSLQAEIDREVDRLGEEILRLRDAARAAGDEDR